jgi:hypothetical protein
MQQSWHSLFLELSFSKVLFPLSFAVYWRTTTSTTEEKSCWFIECWKQDSSEVLCRDARLEKRKQSYSDLTRRFMESQDGAKCTFLLPLLCSLFRTRQQKRREGGQLKFYEFKKGNTFFDPNCMLLFSLESDASKQRNWK